MDESTCVFCEIVAGTKNGRVVYETDSVIALIDPRQANPGHILVIPKDHFQDIYALSEEAGAEIMKAMILLSQTVKKAFDLDGLSIWQSNGPGAHQEVPHVHFHIHPRKIDDGLLRVYPRWLERVPNEELDSYADRVRQALRDD
ncbi:MAG: HIT domain-containing protein [Candidatus Latescibacteria bacterium]|nr:HIT domain-containing protein [Candidatus Latescibacterota bacterium]